MEEKNDVFVILKRLRNQSLLQGEISNIIVYIACGTHANDGIIWREQFVGTYLLDIYEQTEGFFGASGQ